MSRKVGVVRNFGNRGFGIIRVGPESSLERYFLHVANIRSGTATPVAGMMVEFDVSDKPAKEGQLPQAIRADIILPEPEKSKEPEPVRPTEPTKDGGKDGGR
jgi:cold shock CspA family protein